MSLDELVKPKKLTRGDTIAAVTLSWGGPGAIRQRYEIGKRQLQETFGVNVVEMTHTCADPGFIADNPEARAQDLHDAFSDPRVNGIVSTIGGEDSIRLIPYFDFELIAQNPKVFLGYSDTTVTHLACLKAGVSSFYGPSIMSGFAENGGMHDYLIASIRSVLFESEAIGAIAPNFAGWTVELLDWAIPENNFRKRTLTPSTGWHFVQGEGVVQGRLLGGCLEALEWLRGTPVWPTLDQWDGAILFLETSEEAPPPNALVRALRSYAACGVLGRVRGIFLGRPGGQIDPGTFGEYDDAVQQVVHHEQRMTKLPIVTEMDFGHTDPMMTLPYGALAEIDCGAEQIRILEAGVTD